METLQEAGVLDYLDYYDKRMERTLCCRFYNI